MPIIVSMQLFGPQALPDSTTVTASCPVRLPAAAAKPGPYGPKPKQPLPAPFRPVLESTLRLHRRAALRRIIVCQEFFGRRVWDWCVTSRLRYLVFVRTCSITLEPTFTHHRNLGAGLSVL